MAKLVEIASIIKNDIQAGLKGVGNFSFSIEQIEREVIIAKNALVKKYSANGMLRKEDLTQNIECLPLECKDMSSCCDVKSGVTALRVEVPRFASVMDREYVSYAGPINKMMPYKVYYDHTFIYHTLSPHSRKRPYVWFDLGTTNENDTINGYVFNVPRLKKLTVEAIFENPFSVLTCDCEDPSELRFPAPEFIVQEIINSIVYKYVNLYKPQIVVQNTQTSQNNA